MGDLPKGRGLADLLPKGALMQQAMDQPRRVAMTYAELKDFARAILAAAPAPVAQQETADANLLRQIDEFPELNMNNYTDDQVRDLNYWGVRVALAAQEIAAPATPSADSRADFEAHFKLCIRQQARYSVGDYRDSSVNDKWLGWQAAKGAI